MARSRTQYTASFKRSAILLAEKVGNSVATRSLDINESTIRGWRKLRQEWFNCNSHRKGFRGPKKGRFPDLERRLADFVGEQRSRLLCVSIEMLQCKARELARDAGLMPNQFKASRSWIQKFMRRTGFSLRRTTSICQRLPENFESKLLEFQQ